MKGTQLVKTLAVGILMAFSAFNVTAQKMTTVAGNISRTEKSEISSQCHPFWWIARAGYVQTFCDVSDLYYNHQSDEPNISKAGYNFSIGFQKQFNDFGLYYGMDLGVDKTIAPYECEFMTKYPSQDVNTGDIHWMQTRAWGSAAIETPVIYLRPRFGFCHTIAHNWQLDLGLGIGYGYLASGKPEHKSVINGEIDFGFWYRNILMQVAYTPAFTTNDEGQDFLQRVAINVGYRF